MEKDFPEAIETVLRSKDHSIQRGISLSIIQGIHVNNDVILVHCDPRKESEPAGY